MLPAAEKRKRIFFLLGAELQDLYKPLLLDVGAALWAVGYVGSAGPDDKTAVVS